MFKNKILIRNLFWIISTILIVFADQITKYLVANNMELYQEVHIIKGFFNLYYVRNSGAGLGMLSNARWVFMIFTSIVIVVVIALLSIDLFKNVLANISLIFILSGGIGNMIDRIFFGEVIDFLQFQIKYFDFVFNIADIFVTFGTILFVVYYLFFHEDKKQNNVSKSE